MNTPIHRSILVAAAFVFAGCASHAPDTAPPLFPGAVAGDRGPYLTRLVDDLTGVPVADADVFLTGERETPIAGEFWFAHRGRSDADGFVRIPRPAGNRDWNVQVVRHPRYGVVARDSYVEPVWRLQPAFDVPVRIVDWLGRPAPGASIGYCGYCGHSPDLVNAIADGDGIAVLRGIDPHGNIADLYVQQPGLELFYSSVKWRPGEGPMLVRCSDSPPRAGKVVDHRGEPVAGAFVRCGDYHRGPWARTAADGTFVVLGAKPGDCPSPVVLPDGREIHFATGPAAMVTLQLPDLADVRVHHGIARPSRRELPPAVPVATRRLAVRVENAPAEWTLACEYPGAPTEEDPTREHIEAPQSGPFVLVVSDEAAKHASERRFGFDDAASVPDPLVVRWEPDVIVRGRVVSAQGEPAVASVSFLGYEANASPPASAFAVAAPKAGFALLEIAGEDAAVPPRGLWVNVPERGTATHIDLGDIVLGGSPQLRVLGADGAPLATGKVGYLRAGWQQAGEASVWPLSADGGWRGPDLQAGDTIVVELDGDAVPFRQQLVGEGPWTVQMPPGRLQLQVVDAEGEPVAATVVFGDAYAASDKGMLQLQPLPLGPLRLYVSAPRHRSVVLDVDITHSATARRIELPAR
jgi:hypothetical protein